MTEDEYRELLTDTAVINYQNAKKQVEIFQKWEYIFQKMDRWLDSMIKQDVRKEE